MRRFLSRGIALGAICMLIVTSSAQDTEALSKQAIKVRKVAYRLAPGEHIGVVLSTGEVDYGQFRSADDRTLTLSKEDGRTNVVLQYAYVKKLRRGPSVYSGFQAPHVQDRQGVYAAIAICAIAAVLIPTAIAARK